MQCLAVVAVLAVAVPSGAGMRACRIGLVNLDENSKSTRFASLHRSLSELLKPRASDDDGIVGAIEIPRALLKGALKSGCALALPYAAPVWEEQQADFIALYCANSDASSITIALYRGASPTLGSRSRWPRGPERLGRSSSRTSQGRCFTSRTRSSRPESRARCAGTSTALCRGVPTRDGGSVGENSHGSRHDGC